MDPHCSSDNGNNDNNNNNNGNSKFFGRSSLPTVLLPIVAASTAAVIMILFIAGISAALAQTTTSTTTTIYNNDDDDGSNNNSSATTTTAAANTTAAATATAVGANMTFEEARELYLSVWNRTEFNASFSAFVEEFSALGYGIYEERDNVFGPGETIVLYVEPVGVDHRKITQEDNNDGSNDILYLMNLTADYIISDENGTELQVIEDVPVGEVISHRANTEIFLELTLTQEQPFPAGKYIITYRVTDEVSGDSFELEKEIEVVAGTATAAV